jgi:hypothetical protein
MDIYSFINSKDVAAHCREIKHEFTALEQAVIVYKSNQSRGRKLDAWQWIIDNLPDMEVPEHCGTPHCNSLHKLLHGIIQAENNVIDKSKVEDGCIACREIELPLPFKCGDIVVGGGVNCDCFVWLSSSDVVDNLGYTNNDYIIRCNADINWEDFNNLEFYHGELTNENRPLLYISNYLKENISVDLLLNAHGVHVFKNGTHSTCDISRFAATDAPPLPAADFTDIYSYIPSRDIAAHCRKLQHEFNPLEQAFIVYLSDKTLAEKHKAWQKIIDTLPDMEVPESCDCLKYDSLHRLLRDYMGVENRVVEMLKSDEPNAAYSCGYYDEWEENLFPTWESVIAYIQKENNENSEFELCRVRKQWIGAGCKKLTAHIKPDGTIISWEEITVPNHENKENHLFGRLDDMWLKIPTPFKEGDIVIDVTDIHWKKVLCSFGHGPFVLGAISESGYDYSDMTAYGYWVNDDGGIYYECMHAYQNLEYYRKELTGRHRILKAISSHIEGELPVDELLNAYDVILHEEQAENLRNGLIGYTELGRRLVGLGSEVKVVGLFWYIPDEDRLIVEKYPVEESELDSNHVTAKSAHFLVWEKYKDEYKCDYKHYPRGRVNYLPQKDEYELDMDACLSNVTGIIPHDAISRRIAQEFGIDGKGLSYLIGDLSNLTTANGRQEGHYTCYQCRKST